MLKINNYGQNVSKLVLLVTFNEPDEKWIFERIYYIVFVMMEPTNQEQEESSKTVVYFNEKKIVLKLPGNEVVLYQRLVVCCQVAMVD